MRLLVTILLVTACVPVRAVEISNFRSGLACTNTSAREDTVGWICHITEDIFVTDHGRCRYNGQDILCTWVGFEFDYRDARPGDPLQCTISQSAPTAFGNPKEELAASDTSSEFLLPLNEREGHFYNPQYFAFASRSTNEALLVHTGQCSFQGTPLFKYTYRLRFPVLPEHEAEA